MKILRQVTVPTGDILVVEGEKGSLECLSLGDYGKGVNVKCDALGLSRDLQKVEHTQLLPLEQKWVITISTQYGCSMGCKFCDVPKVGPGINASNDDLVNQVATAMSLHPEVEKGRINLHYARMGEPTWNTAVLSATRCLRNGLGDDFEFHPVVSTMMPKKNPMLKRFLNDWMVLKNEDLHGNAGLQISMNSTSDAEREEMFNGNSLDLINIAILMNSIPRPVGRKITLNFAVAGFEIDPDRLLPLFNPDYYLIKLTPMHRTVEALSNGIETAGDYTEYHPYQVYEENLKAAGYDALVFIASKEEDEGLITCGNAILSGSMPTVSYQEVSI